MAVEACYNVPSYKVVKLGVIVTSFSRLFALIVLSAIVTTLVGCNSNEVTQNVEVTIEQNDAGPQEPAANDTINPLLNIGGILAIVAIGFFAMLGFSFRFRVPLRIVVLVVACLAMLFIMIGLQLPALQA